MAVTAIFQVEIRCTCLVLSGIIGGKFLERGRIKKPGQEQFSTQLSQYYMARDLFVGALVEFNCFRFVLIDADEYAYRYMESHGNQVQYMTSTPVLRCLSLGSGHENDAACC